MEVPWCRRPPGGDLEGATLTRPARDHRKSSRHGRMRVALGSRERLGGDSACPTGGPGGLVMSVLDDIVAGVREDLARRQAEVPESELRARLLDLPPAR